MASEWGPGSRCPEHAVTGRKATGGRPWAAGPGAVRTSVPPGGTGAGEDPESVAGVPGSRAGLPEQEEPGRPRGVSVCARVVGRGLRWGTALWAGREGRRQGGTPTRGHTPGTPGSLETLGPTWMPPGVKSLPENRPIPRHAMPGTTPLWWRPGGLPPEHMPPLVTPYCLHLCALSPHCSQSHIHLTLQAPSTRAGAQERRAAGRNGPRPERRRGREEGSHQRPDLDQRAARQGLPRRGKTDRIPAAAVKRSPQIVTELKMAVKSSGLPLITLRATRPSTRARPDERKLLPAVSPTTCATCLLSTEAQAP